MAFENVKPTEVFFKKEIHASQYAAVFLVVVREHTCVMKVHHGRGPRRYYEPEDRELDIHILECSAYRRLKEHGLCDRGLVPNFLGSMQKFDPQLCRPHLNSVCHDEYLPSAIFLDYIPNFEMISIENCTEKRLDNLITGIREIHRARVRHRDPKPRNMMVVSNDPERVVCLDFDRAETYEAGISGHERWSLAEEKAKLAEEEAIVTGFAECLLADSRKGRLDEAYLFYCT